MNYPISPPRPQSRGVARCEIAYLMLNELGTVVILYPRLTMYVRHLLVASLFLLDLLLAVSLANAAGTVQVELVGDSQESAMAFQDWARVLGNAGVANVRLRTVQDADQPGIETQGTPESPIYVVTGIVRSREELLLPGGRFRPSDAARVAQWLNDLAEHGPPSSRPAKAAFGLTVDQFEKVRRDLAAPVGFATRGMTRREIVQRIAERLTLPLALDAGTAQTLADDKLDEPLDRLCCGTALAYLLRPAGYGLVPRASGDDLGYAVVKAAPDREVWPVGRASEKTPAQRLPALYEFLSVNVQDVSAATALETIARRLDLPVLIDRGALARHGIDPAKAMVSLPRSRTTYSLALRKLLAQAGMKFEVRYDDAGKPLLWVTSVKPG